MKRTISRRLVPTEQRRHPRKAAPGERTLRARSLCQVNRPVHAPWGYSRVSRPKHG